MEIAKLISIYNIFGWKSPDEKMFKGKKGNVFERLHI